MHYIELRCSDTVSLERLDNDSRREFGKLRDKALYRQLRASGQFEFPALPASLLSIDTGEIGADDAVVAIVSALEKIREQ